MVILDNSKKTGNRWQVFALLLLFLCLAAITRADPVELQGQFIEGGLAVGKAPVGSTVTLDEIPLQLSPKGVFVLGFHRDAPEQQTLRIVLPDGSTHEQFLSIENRDYAIQRIDGLDQKKVTPPDEVIARIKADAEKVWLSRLDSSAEPAFDETWIWPLEGIITGVYGAQRILNGIPKAPHYGIDIAVPEGTKVRAPAAGRIVLVEDLYYSGITVIIDHGQGIMSALLHLKESTVQVGDTIQQGDIVALSGNTGRSTGPHLDWRVNWFNHARLDASLLVPPIAQSP